MKNFKYIIFILLLITLLSGCKFKYKTTYDFPDAKWVCDNQDIFFISLQNEERSAGEIKINNIVYPFVIYYRWYSPEIQLCFEYSATELEAIVSGSEGGFEIVLTGSYRLTDNKFIIYVDDINQEKLPLGDVKELVFHREAFIS